MLVNDHGPPVDTSILHSLNGFFVGHDAIEDPVLAYVNAAEVLFAAVIVVLFAIGRGRWAVARRAGVAAAASTGLALLLAKIVSTVVDRPRPFVADPHGVHLFAAHAADPGFPSDHATAAFAIAVAVLLRNRPLGIVLTVLAAILAVGRVAIGVHYPTDVLAGAALGALTAVALWAPPLRRLLDRLAAAAGGVFDGVLRRTTAAGRA
jgi:undecaprenyl-diphosphatase